MISEDRDFKFWLSFFSIPKQSLNKFKYLLTIKDNYFLNHGASAILDFNDENYSKIKSNGFLEYDFQKVLKNENPKENYYKTRLAIAFAHGLDFSNLKKSLKKENFNFVVERVLIDAEYEYYNIDFNEISNKLLSKKLVDENLILECSFFRGFSQGSKRTENQIPAFRTKLKFLSQQYENYKKNLKHF